MTRMQRALSALWLCGLWGCGDLEIGSAESRDGGGALEEGGSSAGAGDLSSVNDAVEGDYYARLRTPAGPGTFPIQLTLTPTSQDQGTYETKCLDKMVCPSSRDAGPADFDPVGDLFFGFISLLNTSGTYRLLDFQGDGSASGILWFADGPLGLSTTFEAKHVTVKNPAGGESLTFSRTPVFPNQP